MNVAPRLVSGDAQPPRRPGKFRYALAVPFDLETFEARLRRRSVRMGRIRRTVAAVMGSTSAVFDFEDVFSGVRAIDPRASRGAVSLALRRFLSVGLIRRV